MNAALQTDTTAGATRIAITTWPSLAPEGGEVREVGVEQLFGRLRRPARFGGTWEHGGWSAAVFDPARREASNVQTMTALVLDYDKGDPIAAAVDLWGGWRGIVHTTRSHEPAAPRFRVVLPLARPVSVDDYGRLWRWAEERARGEGHTIDPNPKDPSRFWYWPGTPDGAPHEVVELGSDGADLLDPDEVLAAVEAADQVSEAERAGWAPSKSVASPGADVIDRARQYLARMDPSVSGHGGHKALWRATVALWAGFALDAPRVLALLESDFNPRCLPAWSQGELEHKVTSAERRCTLARGYLLASRRAPDGRQGGKATAPPSLPEDVHPCTDLANAHRLVNACGTELRHCGGLGWLVWDGARWEQDATGAATRHMHDVARAIKAEADRCFADAEAAVATATGDNDGAGKERAKRALAHAKGLLGWSVTSQQRNRLEAGLAVAQSFERVVAVAEDFDRDPMLLNARNGTVDLRNGRIRAHRREDLCTKLAPVEWAADATCLTWLAFLQRIFAGDADLIGFVQRAVGYCLTGETGEQCFFLCWGTGANGKSTLLEVLREVLGDYASNAAADVLMTTMGGRGPDNDVARLRGARFVSASESGEGRRLDEERVKRLTGGDVVTARFLYREHFEFRPTFKLFLATNAKPEIRGTDFAIWRRVRLIPFAVTIPPEEQDPKLRDHLLAEAPGILRWAVDGCLAWQRDGLQPPEAVTSATADYRDDQNTVGRFIAEECMVLPDASATASALYERFCEWCRKVGEESVSQRAFGGRLASAGFSNDRDRRRGRFWQGIGLIAEDGGRDG